MTNDEKQYFDYLCKEIFDAIKKAEDYKKREYIGLKISLLEKLYLILQSEEKFNIILNILNENEDRIKVLTKQKK